MKPRWSEELERVLRQDPPEELGKAAIREAEEAIDAGDTERAKGLMEYARNEWQVVHDMYVNWAWAFFTYIQRQHEEEAREDVYRPILGGYYRGRYDKGMASDTETQLQPTVEGLREHLMGPGRRREVDLVDESKRWRIYMELCGSGGVAIKRLRSGGEPNPELFGFSERAHDWTWSKENMCLYCGHCAFVNGILAIENYGHPLRVTEYSGADDGHCTWYIYKEPKDIPAEYYERVGKTPPPHVPHLSDEPGAGEGA
jgi:hypothetical protein